ncbi:endoribonuclease Dicer [Agrilus planipennis]|uniref:Endoribonuclease Dicer n=1 Tax=Agrilus planipennis TaxID=224129 RepID=A0A1W4X5J6_AGRPL|nr:endoribonuclease Dicer [Agrilus planipennis]
MDESVVETDFQPRNYQLQLMKIALKQNTILFLPTGSGKTFIAVLLIKRLSQDLEIPVKDGGKVTLFLVSTVALVDQHSKTLQRHTAFKIGSYSGDMNIDSWSKTAWDMEINSNQILVMTAQIAVNIVSSGYLSLSNINLLIFDECHHAVNDEPMRQLMKHFENVIEKPRVLGLTATLLNGNVKPDQVLNEVKKLETTFQSKVATVDELKFVIGYSTNPEEKIMSFRKNPRTCLEDQIFKILETCIKIVQKIPKIQNCQSELANKHIPLGVEKTYKDYVNMLKDIQMHVDMLGPYGGLIAALSYMIYLEKIKRHCEDSIEIDVINGSITYLHIIRNVIKRQLKPLNDEEIISHYSSSKLLMLFKILRNYQAISKVPLSALIFTERKFTAKILYHIFKKAREVYPEFKNYDADFAVGFSNNPNIFNREPLYTTKMNKKAIQKFDNKDVNILFSTNVLEEGIDISLCSLVVRFDLPKDYRSYIQSKGRARHKNSHFYMMVENSEIVKFQTKYSNYQRIEQILCDILIGRNDERDGPSEDDIQKVYNEDCLPPYYVNGPGSSQINCLNSISKLSQYCQTLASDQYTTFQPEWFLERNKEKRRVIIELPIVCPIIDQIEGTWECTIKDAKRTAAYNACVMLHKKGELDDFLLPVGNSVKEKDTKHLFKHIPEPVDKSAGNSTSRRPYLKQAPQMLTFHNCAEFYLHVVDLNPSFSSDYKDSYRSTILDLFESDLCYGIITKRPLPKLCSFPIYVSRGQIRVEILTNAKIVTLNHDQIMQLRLFNYILYHDVLKILRNFLILNNNESSEECHYLVTPIKKSDITIAFDIITENQEIADPTRKPSVDQILKLDVDNDKYLGKIVTPWYKHYNKNYIVVEICYDMDAKTPFPGGSYDSFESYFSEKYNVTILNSKAPLLHVKALASGLNLLRPRSSKGKRKREEKYEGMKEHICPELCVKQEFPSPLWLQASLLPSILHRFDQLIRAEDLRTQIAEEAGVGVTKLNDAEKWKPLEIYDNQLIDNEQSQPQLDELNKTQDEDEIQEILATMKADLRNVRNDVCSKMLNQQYPWSEKDEPVDIDRNLDVTLIEIQYYDNFVSREMNANDVLQSRNNTAILPAITYDNSYVYCDIKILSKQQDSRGPELRDIYQALCTAKCNEIVNFERLETLGDSFLKLSTTLYIFVRFPKYNEGQATQLKSKLVSNKNLYYLGLKKNLQSYVKNSDFLPDYDWVPPGFITPHVIAENYRNSKIDLPFLTNLEITKNEAVAGILTKETEEKILNNLAEGSRDTELSQKEFIYPFLNIDVVADKTIADCVEAILGVYCQSNGLLSALKMLEWFEIIPKEENITHIFNDIPQSPLLRGPDTERLINLHLTKGTISKIEERLGYTFRNKGYLLQALTHSSYTPNRVTNCYQRLEFLGDAILDFLITCHIYETCGKLNPGELTDLRSALVNNITFAGIAVRLGLHKFLLFSNQQLSKYIDSFVSHQESKEFVIDEQVLILLEEKDTGVYLSEHIDVPKVLGDVFEAMVGAIFLDSGSNLHATWEFIHRVMWQEISTFKVNVPKNAVRLLYETQRTHPQFYDPVKLDDRDVCMMRLDFMANGERKTVYGFGDNKIFAKRAAAKFALRLLK